MDDRLGFFRQQMAAFDGAADPRGAISQGFYIEEPEHSVTNQLLKRVSLKPNSRNLLLGGIGSGKTTQLLKIEQLLQNTDIYPHYIDVTQYIDLGNYNLSVTPQEGTLNTIFGLELIKLLRSQGVLHDGKIATLIQNYAYGTTEAIGYHNPSGNVITKIGVLASPRAAGISEQIAHALSVLADSFKGNCSKEIFFLLDGLDRVLDAEKFIRLASTGTSSRNIGFLLVGPVSLLYSHFADRIDDYFNYFEYRPAFDVQNSQAAYDFFKAVIESRSEPSFFSQDALHQLIYLSGGVLRDLINLTQESIQEAYLTDAEQIEIMHVNAAARSLGRAKILGLDNLDNRFLSDNLNEEGISIPIDNRTILLLANGRILEYRYPKRRFAIHPVLRSLLSMHALV